MKYGFFNFWIFVLVACAEPKANYPVYKVDLDNPHQVMPADLFAKVEAVPLQTTEKSHFVMGELGVKDDRYYILDRNRQLFFCFDTSGNFRYVMDNSPKDKEQPVNPKLRSILNPYSYYYKKEWYYYLTFRNLVYTIDQQGVKHPAYRWDFGEYNDDKEVVVRFPALPLATLVPLQQAWLKGYCDFALTNARQSTNYIYTLVERIADDTLLAPDQRFYHLFCHKPTGKCYYFGTFSDGHSLDMQLRLEEKYIMMLLPWWQKEKYENLDILEENSRRIIKELKETDNPVVLKWWLKM